MEKTNRTTQILIMEDEIEFQKTIKKIYQKYIENGQIKWEWAKDGEEGIQKAETLRPEVLVVDLDLPKINGFDIIKKLTSKKYVKKIIPYTGKFDEEKIKKLSTQYDKISNYYIKSINKPEELLEHLELYNENFSNFNYQEFSPDIQQFLKEKTQAIKGLMGVQIESVIKMGWELEKVKRKLKHGEFEKWLNSEFSLSTSSARKYIKTAKEFQGIQNINELNISNTAAYALAQNNTPTEVKEELIKRAREGEYITPATVKKTIKEYKENPHFIKTDSIEVASVKVEDQNQVNQPQIIKVIEGQNLHLLGKHTLYKGAVNQKRFLKQLPKKIQLFIAFLSPDETLELPPHLQVNQLLEIYSNHDSTKESSSDWEELIRISIESLTDVNDNIVINRIPNPEILINIDLIGCTGYISEENPHQIEAIKKKWEEYHTHPNQVKRMILNKYEEKLEIDQEYLEELREQL